MSGVTHWWRQRVSSVLLIPVTFWLLWFGARVSGASFAEASALLAAPFNALAAALTVALVAYHAQSGIQVIVEDYVPGKALPAALIGLTRLGCAVGTVAVWWSVWSVASGGAA